MAETLDKLSPEMIKHIESFVSQIPSEYITGKRKSIHYDLRIVVDEPGIKYDETNIDYFVEIFTKSLKEDIENVKNNMPVSDCGYFSPRTTTNSELKKLLARRIATNLYPVSDNNNQTLIGSYVGYQKCISLMTKLFKQQEFLKVVEKEKFKISRLSEHRELWESLKNRPMSQSILEPTAMPVDVAPEDELQPFFNFLQSGNFVVPHEHEEYDCEWISEESCFKFKRGAIYTDGRMDLCKQVVGPPHIRDLMNSIINNEHIEHFLLGNNIIGPNGGKAIRDFLLNEHKPKIKTWYLAGNDLNVEGIAYIVDGLMQDNDVKELWLKRNPIKPEGAQHIKRLLETNVTIITLDLHNTGLLDEGLKYVCEGLDKNTTLKNLYLDANGIVNIDPLVEYFREKIETETTGITSLWIDMNRLSDAGAIKLCNILKDYPIEKLCIGSNMISQESCETIYNAFRNHATIKLLDIGLYKSTADMGEITNRIAKGATRIAKLIRENKTLEFISVMHNDIDNTGLEEICDAVQENDTLLFIDLKQYFSNIETEVQRKINDKLELNRKNRGISNNKMYLRFLKHTKEIVNIDSIYRNNDKGATSMKCCIKN